MPQADLYVGALGEFPATLSPHTAFFVFPSTAPDSACYEFITPPPPLPIRPSSTNSWDWTVGAGGGLFPWSAFFCVSLLSPKLLLLLFFGFLISSSCLFSSFPAEGVQWQK